MKFAATWLLTMLLFSCSLGKKATDVGDESAGGDLAEVDEFSDDFLDDESKSTEGGETTEVADGEDLTEGVEATPAETTDTGDGSTEALGSENTEGLVAATEPTSGNNTSSGFVETQPIQTTGEQSVHIVAANETLMMIAFKYYGDTSRWRELANLNRDVLNSYHSLRIGMSIRYETPSTPFVWNPPGNPYLIRRGDSLGSISTQTYGNKGYWKNIWENNRPLIKNPNLIYAGFTIYTPNLENRGVANTEL